MRRCVITDAPNQRVQVGSWTNASQENSRVIMHETTLVLTKSMYKITNSEVLSRINSHSDLLIRRRSSRFDSLVIQDGLISSNLCEIQQCSPLQKQRVPVVLAFKRPFLLPSTNYGLIQIVRIEDEIVKAETLVGLLLVAKLAQEDCQPHPRVSDLPVMPLALRH